MAKTQRNIPELRFPEFEEDGEWEDKPLKKLADKVSTKNRDGQITKVLTNSAVDGIVDQREYFDKDIANKKNLKNYYVVEAGDYVYNPRVSNIAPVGPIAKNRTCNTGVMSPLYDNNAIAVATDLISFVTKSAGRIKTVIRTHNRLFYKVLWNELKSEKTQRYFLYKGGEDAYTLQKTDDTPYFHHVALLSELKKATELNKVYSYHFNALRSILEKTASFFGQKDLKFCLQGFEDEVLYNRALNLLSHGKYSIYQPVELSDDNKNLFKKILNDFLTKYEFDIPQLIS